MEAAMRVLLPRLLGGLSFKVYTHQCKEELLTRLPDRLRGYSRWLPKNWRVVVLIDRDDDDCRQLKSRLEQIAGHAGLISRSADNGKTYAIVNRLAIEELESWYFGDWSAVSAAYPRASRDVSQRAQFRNPDAIRGGTWEAFERSCSGLATLGAVCVRSKPPVPLPNIGIRPETSPPAFEHSGTSCLKCRHNLPGNTRSLPNGHLNLGDEHVPTQPFLNLGCRRAFEEKLRRFTEIIAGGFYRVALAHNVQFRTKSDKAIVFLVNDCS